MSLDSRIRAFNSSRCALLNELAKLNSATLAARPLAGEGSQIEIVEHLVLAERAIFQGLPEFALLSRSSAISGRAFAMRW